MINGVRKDMDMGHSVLQKVERQSGRKQTESGRPNCFFFLEVLREVNNLITQLRCTLYLYKTTVLKSGGGAGANHTAALHFRRWWWGGITERSQLHQGLDFPLQLQNVYITERWIYLSNNNLYSINIVLSKITKKIHFLFIYLFS